MEIRPIDIIKAVDAVSPFQKAAIENSYQNLSVTWSLLFKAVFDRDNGMVRLALLDLNNIYPWVYCIVKLEDFPELKILRQDTVLIVKGNIEHVHGHEIQLRNASIKGVETKRSFAEPAALPELPEKSDVERKNTQKRKWWDNGYIQIIGLISSILGIVGFFLLLF